MTKNLTEGKIFKTLFLFTLPMFISVVFQQLYGIVDTIVVGQKTGTNGLAAMGVTFPLIMICMSFAIGYCVGSSIIIAQLFARQEMGRAKTAIYTSIFISLILAVVVSAIGVGISKPMLVAIKTPPEILNDANEYQMIIIGAGGIFSFVYNSIVGAYQALGNTKLPLFFLILSTVVNIILDLIFVMVLEWGIQGAAWATVISQAVACVLALIVLLANLKKIETEKFKVFRLKVAWQTIKFSIPIVLQQASIFIGALLIQNMIFMLYKRASNRSQLLTSTAAGYTVSGRLIGIAVMCVFTMANGLTNFTAQNIAVGKYDRIKKGFWVALIMSLVTAAVFIVTFEASPEGIARAFSKTIDDNGVDVTRKILIPVTPFMAILAFKLAGDAILRGSGSMVQYFITTFIDLAIRVALAYALAEKLEMYAVAVGFIVGWVVSAILSISFLISRRWKKEYEKNKIKKVFKRYPELFA